MYFLVYIVYLSLLICINAELPNRNLLKTPDLCYAALDIVQVQDVTHSFNWPLSQLSLQAEKVTSLIGSLSNTRFGLVTFSDKNIADPISTNKMQFPMPVGYSGDYCARIDIPLQPPNAQLLTQALNRHDEPLFQGGGDAPEAVVDALYRTATSTKINWRDFTGLSSSVAKVMILVTDAVSHLPDDDLYFYDTFFFSKDLPTELDNINYRCDTGAYVSFKTLASILADKNIYVIVLVTSGFKYDAEGRLQVPISLASKGVRYQSRDGLLLWYKDNFEEAGIQNALFAQIESDMSTYLTAIYKTLSEFNRYRCQTTYEIIELDKIILIDETQQVASTLPQLPQRPEKTETQLTDATKSVLTTKKAIDANFMQLNKTQPTPKCLKLPCQTLSDCEQSDLSLFIVEVDN